MYFYFGEYFSEIIIPQLLWNFFSSINDSLSFQMKLSFILYFTGWRFFDISTLKLIFQSIAEYITEIAMLKFSYVTKYTINEFVPFILGSRTSEDRGNGKTFQTASSKTSASRPVSWRRQSPKCGESRNCSTKLQSRRSHSSDHASFYYGIEWFVYQCEDYEAFSSGETTDHFEDLVSACQRSGKIKS